MNNEEKILTILESMQAEQQKTNGRLDRIEAEQQKADGRFDRIESKLGSVESKLGSVESKLGSVESELGFVKATVVRIENDHGKKLDTLFDGYQQLNEKVDRIEKHVSAQDEVILKRVFPMAATK